ncbi:hypothetical protein TSH58p_07290 [Azospirillum sp. TSH58]|uniref:hypothetical protein n=1 Tax=Azospirillum sp. TSH58 TaxID=664962 RepID=UPI000D5FEE20|nr:hypothetical protein [Azospirillum sp. TSH58]AWJ83349.1 hypothetical protein TSH58p_07290 [Azospirillum sp. TSH58]PWC73095.1 hypothetical protein TSH58_05240 [Azospirillum sp. TSH58]
MVAYSFRPRFIDPILAGLEHAPLLPGMKRQTIRGASGGKRHARPGELVQLYTGMRTRQCRKLGEGRCVAAEPVTLLLEKPGLVIIGDAMTPADEHEAARQLDAFAIYDGFRDWPDLVAFWAAEHPGLTRFEGVLIRWEPLAGAEVRP